MSIIFPDHEVMRVEIYYRKKKNCKKNTQTLTSDSSAESNNILKDSYTQIKWSLSGCKESSIYTRNNQGDTQH